MGDRQLVPSRPCCVECLFKKNAVFERHEFFRLHRERGQRAPMQDVGHVPDEGLGGNPKGAQPVVDKADGAEVLTIQNEAP